MASEYSADNIFAKILDKEEPCFKVYESRNSLAFLDANPVAEGHTIVVTKLKGHTDFLSMPPAKAADFLSDVQRVARAVKEATGATAVNILQNNGADAGQTVFHPHFHVIPRKAGDGVLTPPAGAKAMLGADAAGPVQAKIEAALNPQKPLKKAKFGKVSSIRPDSTGLNLQLKVVGEAQTISSKAGDFTEVLCGDPSGTVVVSLRDNQKDVAKKDAIISLRNATAKIVSGHLRLTVDKWGKVGASDEGMDEAVEMDEAKNVSATEFELVPGSKK